MQARTIFLLVDASYISDFFVIVAVLKTYLHHHHVQVRL